MSRKRADTTPLVLTTWAPPAEPGPAPAGADLVVEVSCSTSRASDAPSSTHEVVIRRDWSVWTPHDLASERVAAALGGHLSCLGLVDRAVPALRTWAGRSARRELPEAIFEGGRKVWRPKVRFPGCCEPRGYSESGGLGEHVRDAGHLAARTGADPRQVATLVAASRGAHQAGAELTLPPGPAEAAARCCTGFRFDVSDLWRAGVHPDLVLAIHRALGVSGPVPARYLLGVVVRRPDLRWLDRTLDRTLDERGDRKQFTKDAAAAQLAWLGVAYPLAVELAAAGYCAVDVEQLSAALGRTCDGVSRTLVEWVRAGCHPSVADLVALRASGVPSVQAVAGPALRRLREEAGARAYGRDDTELGLLLAAVGNVPQALAGLRSDPNDPTTGTGA